jgi:hypothetical protein
MKKVLLVLLILWVGCVGQKKSYNLDESRDIAREFVLTSPTYTYDGEGLESVDATTLECDSCWQFTFTFTSRHGGYGDRTGKMVTQAITPHVAAVTVENGKVTRATLDDTWDMIAQKMMGE